MKTIGIVFVVIAILSAFGTVYAISRGQAGSLAGPLTFGLIGAYLIYRANRKKGEDENKKRWENEN